MRAVREIFRPSLKCERVGHVAEIEFQRGWSYPPEWRSMHVADEATRKRSVCKRCRAALSDWTVTRKCGLNGLTMSSGKWDVLKETGFVEEG